MFSSTLNFRTTTFSTAQTVFTWIISVHSRRWLRDGGDFGIHAYLMMRGSVNCVMLDIVRLTLTKHAPRFRRFFIPKAEFSIVTFPGLMKNRKLLLLAYWQKITRWAKAQQICSLAITSTKLWPRWKIQSAANRRNIFWGNKFACL